MSYFISNLSNAYLTRITCPCSSRWGPVFAECMAFRRWLQCGRSMHVSLLTGLSLTVPHSEPILFKNRGRPMKTKPVLSTVHSSLFASSISTKAASLLTIISNKRFCVCPTPLTRREGGKKTTSSRTQFSQYCSVLWNNRSFRSTSHKASEPDASAGINTEQLGM